MAELSDDIGSLGAVGAIDTASVDDAASASAVQDFQAAVGRVNHRLSSYSRVLELNVDATSGLTVATIKDSRTGEVLQQFPGTNSLHLAQMLAEWAGSKNALLDLLA